jgi:PST family polysaccharide transporter
MIFREKIFKGIVWSAIQNWGSQVGSLIVFFLLARLLAPEAFGLVALANIFLAFMQIFLNQGFAQVLIQRQKLEPESINTAFWTNLAIGIFLSVIGFTTAGLVAQLFQEPQLRPILQGFSPLFVIASGGNIQQALLERNLAFKAMAFRTLAGTFIGGLVGVVMAVCGFGVWSLVSQQLMQEFVGSLALWKASNWRPKFLFSFKHFQLLFSFGSSILGFNLLRFFSTRADDFLIGYFLGPVALGYYSIAYRTLQVMTQVLLKTSTQITLPVFSRLQEEIARFRQAFYTATRLTSAIAFPIFIAVAILARELILLAFGEQWLPSVPVLQVLAFVGIVKSVSFFKDSVFIALGKPSWSLWLGLLNVGLNLIGFAIAVRWGIVAVALAYTIRGYLVFPITQWVISRLLQTPLLSYLRQFLVPLSSSLVMAIAILTSKYFLLGSLNSPVLLALCLLIGAIAYSLTMCLFLKVK